ncbi:phytosulfokine receptor 1-like [Elaeis guineensis]|uniref:phytosulfokine receptor 1-like n=1 Tax=Elaeis guineensis var. tenera TaxID=51953 RepID=UPI003C6CECB3
MKNLLKVLLRCPFYSIFFLFSFCYPIHAANYQNLSCTLNDLRALLRFSNGLDSGIDGWRMHDDPSVNCCSWVGVRCALFSVSSPSAAANSTDLSLRVVGLDLARRSLKGILSNSIGELDRLSFLNLSHNSFRGPLPQELFHLRRLEVLDLASNNFTGELGQGIRNLASLSYLDVSFNGFTGSIPNTFNHLQKLESFSAESNSLVGQLPNSLSSCSMLRLLNLRNNSLDGAINLDFTKLVHLVQLDLGWNQFHGIIPESLSLCRALKVLNLARNHLYGQIPRRFRDLQALSDLSLSNNSISNIPSGLETLQECRNLTVLVLTMNFYGEELPISGIQGFQNLRVLVVAFCALTGTVPSWIVNSKELSLLDLSWNHLTGGIPVGLGCLDFLFYLDLSNNSLSGEIPMSITKLKSLSSESFWHAGSSSGFPLFVWRNQTGTGQLQYKKYTNLPPTLDLSYNMMNGTMRKEIGNLRLLQVLDLSRNSLSGSIPDELSGMLNLEKLDLSFNDLSGTIPSSLVKLNFLSSFSVAHNRLHGQIPTEGQFSTFPRSSFEGNPGFCGVFFFFCNSTIMPPELEQNDREGTGLVIKKLPLAIGFIAGFLPTVILFGKCWGYYNKDD